MLCEIVVDIYYLSVTSLFSGDVFIGEILQGRFPSTGYWYD